jgi:hypothetical protein
MGYSVNFTGGPLMCFNAHKYWTSGWISDRQIEIKVEHEAWQGNILAFMDYPVARKGDVVVIHFSDVFFLYNRAKGINAQVFEKKDQVTVVQAQNNHSTLLAGLSKGSTMDYKHYRIEICSFTTDASGRDYARLQVTNIHTFNSCIDSKNSSMIFSPKPSHIPTLVTSRPTTRKRSLRPTTHTRSLGPTIFKTLNPP